MKTLVLCAFCAIVGLQLNAQSKQMMPISAALRNHPLYTVGAITTQYDDNEIQAESIFRGKPTNMWGIVSDISTGIINGAHVSLTGNLLDGGTGIDCVVEPAQLHAFEQIHKGSVIIVKGNGGQKIMGTVFFHNCELSYVVPQDHLKEFHDWYESRKPQLKSEN